MPYSDAPVHGTVPGFMEKRDRDSDTHAETITKRAFRLMVYSRTRKAQPYVVLTFRLPADLFFDIDWGDVQVGRPPAIGAPLTLGVDGTLVSFLQFKSQNQAFLNLAGHTFDCNRLLRVRLPCVKWNQREHPLMILDSQGDIMSKAVLRLQRERLAIWTAVDHPIQLVNAYEPFDVNGPRLQNVDFLS